jgi:hypothetical protein
MLTQAFVLRLTPHRLGCGRASTAQLKNDMLLKNISTQSSLSANGFGVEIN